MSLRRRDTGTRSRTRGATSRPTLPLSIFFSFVRKDLKKALARGEPITRAATFCDEGDEVWLAAVASDARRFSARLAALDVSGTAAERAAAKGALASMAALLGGLFSDETGVA